MNTPKYDGRLPMLRCSQALEKMVVEEANRQHISLAEAHRQILARNLLLQPDVKIIPIVGTVDQNDIIHEFAKAA